MSNYIIIICLSVIFLIITRFVLLTRLNVLRAYFQKGPVGDASLYFFFAQFLKNNKIGEIDKRALITDGKNGVCFPPLFASIVNSFFNLETVYYKSWLPNFIFYSVSIIFIYLLFFFKLIYLNDVLIFTLSLFLNYDNLVFNKSRISNISFTPRGITILVSSFASFALILISGAQNIILYVIIFLSSFVLINSSYFGRQIVLLIYIPFTLFLNDVLLILVTISPIVISLFISRFLFKRSLIMQFNFLKRHFNDLKNAKNLPVYKKVFNRSVLESFNYLGFFIVLFLLLSSNNTQLYFLRDFYLIVFFVFILTSIRLFSFLGDSFRYISTTTFFLEPYIISVLSESNPEVVLCIILARITVVFISVFRKSDLDISLFPKNITSYIQTSFIDFKDSVWFSVPFRESTSLVSLGYGQASFEFQFGQDNTEIISNYFIKHPYLSKDLIYDKKYNVSHIIVNKKYLKHAQEVCFLDNYGFNEFSLLFEDESHILYSIKK